MSTILSKPFPHDSSLKKQCIYALVSGVLVALFLGIFKPFGIEEIPENKWIYAGAYGLITTLVILFMALMHKLFPGVFEEKQWTVGKNIVLYCIIIVLIGTCNLLFTSFMFHYPLNIGSFFSFQFFTLSVGLFIVSALTLIRYGKLVSHYRSGAIEMEKELKDGRQRISETADGKKEIAVTQNSRLILTSENDKEKAEYNPSDILFLESADNYTKIISIDKGKIKTTIIRSSLKRLESQLTDDFYRCHRSFIVNLSTIHHISGNSQGYRLHFKDTEDSIPVARGSGKELKEKLSK